MSFIPGYAAGAFAPGGYDITGVDMYQAGHNIIRSHARAYHTYDDNYRSMQQGKIGITLNTNWNDPLEATNPEHRDARVSADVDLVLFEDFVLGQGTSFFHIFIIATVMCRKKLLVLVIFQIKLRQEIESFCL